MAPGPMQTGGEKAAPHCSTAAVRWPAAYLASIAGKALQMLQERIRAQVRGVPARLMLPMQLRRRTLGSDFSAGVRAHEASIAVSCGDALWGQMFVQESGHLQHLSHSEDKHIQAL